MLSQDKLQILMEYYECTNIDTLRCRSVINVDTDIYNDLDNDTFMRMIIKSDFDLYDDMAILKSLYDKGVIDNKGVQE